MASLTQSGSKPKAYGATSDRVRLLDLLRVFGSRWRGILAGALTGLIVCTVAVLIPPTQYVSSVRVWVRDAPRTLDPAFAENQRSISIDTEAQRLISQGVLAAAGIDDHTKVQITAPPNSTILRMQLTASDPRTAQDQVAALANAYLDARRTFLEGRRTSLNSELAAQRSFLTKRLQQSASSDERARWQAALEKLLAQETYYQTARTDPGRVVSAASEGRRATKNWEVAPLSGAVLGALSGFALAYVGSGYRRTEDQ